MRIFVVFYYHKCTYKARFGPAALALAALYLAISACCFTLSAPAFFSYPALAAAGHLAHLKNTKYA